MKLSLNGVRQVLISNNDSSQFRETSSNSDGREGCFIYEYNLVLSCFMHVVAVSVRQPLQEVQ